MKFGTFHLFQWHEDKSPEQVFRETVELVRISEELGFSSVWLAEHHFSRYGLGSSVLNVASHLAGLTKTMRIGTAVVVLPFYNPITLAEEIATVDQLSGGRFELGVGRGYQWSEFHRLNVPFEESRERFDESLEIMRLAWTEEQFSYQGKFWTVNDARVLPKPVQKPHPPITVATSSPSGYQNAAQRGQSILCGGSTTALATVADNLKLYRESLAAAGYTYDPAHVKMSRPVFVAESREEAYAYTREHYDWFLAAQRAVAVPPADSLDLIPPKEREALSRMLDRAPTPFDEAYETIGIYGTPEECVRRIEALDKLVGGLPEMMCSFALGGWDQQKVIRSMELFARDVMPHFQRETVVAASS
jgi:alkanesulfonate monooxygenase SsuD/methylene tetrahydromethanopterin reductase-like flavin-dependent oxidoreductase (luciferase family)